MYKRLFVPLDNSDVAESAIPTARQLARILDARLVLFQAVSSEFWYAGGAAGMPVAPAINQETIDAYLDSARSYLEGLADPLRQEGFSVETATTIAPASSAIAETAAAEPDTLIVMATHGRTGLSRAVLGSVAMAVVGQGQEPVLLVRPDSRPLKTLHRIIVTLDGSPLAEQILLVVTPLASAAGAGLVLCRVTVEGETAADVNAYLAAVAERLRSNGLTVETMALEGDPITDIIDAVDSASAQMIAMTTHGRSAIGRLFSGSVAEGVLARTPVPVLLVKGQTRRE